MKPYKAVINEMFAAMHEWTWKTVSLIVALKELTSSDFWATAASLSNGITSRRLQFVKTFIKPLANEARWCLVINAVRSTLLLAN